MTTPAAARETHPWELLRSELVRFVRTRVDDEGTADDIVHDVLLRALAALEGPEPPRHLRGWLYRATRNALVDHYRARRPASELPADLAEGMPESQRSAESELARCLEPLLATLPPDDRVTLALAEVEGLAQKEIARRAGLSLSGAKSRVQRARARLRAALLACCRVEVDRRGGVLDFEARPSGAGCASPSPEPPRPASETSGGCDCRSDRPRA